MSGTSARDARTGKGAAPERAEDLARLAPDELCERLAKLAAEARKDAVEGRIGELARKLEDVKAAAAVASGEQLRLLEVAEAFLRAMSRTDLGRREVALHVFFMRHPREAYALFSKLLSPASLGVEEQRALPEEVQEGLVELVRVGALRRDGDALALSPAVIAVARELREPAVLRMWRAVEQCRKDIAQDGLNIEEGARFLSGRLGITVEQGRRHLEEHPAVRHRMPLVHPSMQGMKPAHLFLMDNWVFERLIGSGIDIEETSDLLTGAMVNNAELTLYESGRIDVLH
jgi:hypothetical protein